MQTWRLLDTPPLSAAENMALDDTLLEARNQGLSPNTLHFLQFSPRAVLVGYHQAVSEEIRTDYCLSQGIEINRRVTGGGAIFFDASQLGWELIADKAFFGVRLPTPRLFQDLCEPVVLALERLGLRATFRPRNDIEIQGRKISGTGGTDAETAFLFQGTMLTDFDVDTMLRALRIPVEKLKAKEIDSVKERVTCLKWELGRVPDLAEIKEAIVHGFSTRLGIALLPGGLTPEEERLFAEKLPRYRSREWIDAVLPKAPGRDVLQAAYKSEAGFVRFTLVIAPGRKRIKEIYITGDFLSFPPRGLFDLEARLRGRPLEKALLHGILEEAFGRGEIHIPDMGVADFKKPLDQIFEKLSIASEGLPLEGCNRISVTNGSFREVLDRVPDALLLPYCAKLTGCDLRHEKGCRACGGCTVGEAWDMGAQAGMEVVSIVSFEDLMEELRRLKARGARAFIGCCCQPFFTKHVDDFEGVGLPGILIDIDNTTCYDLDQAREAYAGRFSSQTCLDLGLLRRVLDLVPRGVRR